MTEFTRMKISFALALLGTLFALHPFLDRAAGWGFVYLGADLKLFYAYSLTAGLLSLCVYCYAVTLLSSRPHSWFERTGNSTYALAVLVLPVYGGLFLSARLADAVAVSHVAWAAPAVALGLGVGWALLTQLVALRIRRRLGDQDRAAKLEQLAAQEKESLNQARELFDSMHYDLSVIEACRALESRLRQVLLARRLHPRAHDADALVALAARKGLIGETTLNLLHDLHRHKVIALSTDPLARDDAVTALSAVRHVLSTLPVRTHHGALPATPATSGQVRAA